MDRGANLRLVLFPALLHAADVTEDPHVVSWNKSLNNPLLPFAFVGHGPVAPEPEIEEGREATKIE